MKILTIALVILIAILISTLRIFGYYGARSFEDFENEYLPPIDTVVANARKLIGTPYDPLMGMYGNIGSDLGFIVCSDVPNIAYGLSGISLEILMDTDFKMNPSAYNSANNNTPSNPYIHRRARNIYFYFQSKHRLMGTHYQPSPGDFAFYTKKNTGYVSHVALVTEITESGFRVVESATKTLFAREVNDNSPIERGWSLAGFGSIY